MREGRRTRPIPTVVVDEDAQPIDRHRLISTWSLAAIAVIAVGCAIYFDERSTRPGRHRLRGRRHAVAACGKARGERRAARLARPALIVVFTALLIGVIAALIASPVAELMGRLPELRGKLQVFHGLIDFWRHIATSIGINPTAAEPTIPVPSIAWAPAAIGFISPPVTEFLYFLVVLLLFISWWPDLRRQLVMTFASRDARLTVLKILNEMEASLASYLFTVTCINLGVGAAAGLIAAFTGLPFPIGFGALGATLNFIPIVGPIAMIAILLVVGVVTAPSLGLGLLPAGLFMLVVFLEGQFITPAIIGRRIEINSLAVILSLMFWTWMWGPMGAFLSSPLLIVALILRQYLGPES